MGNGNQQQQNQAAPRPVPAPPSDCVSTVTVACKLPHGFNLTIDEMLTGVKFATPLGFVEGNISRRLPGNFIVHGIAVPYGVTPRFDIVCGYAFTRGIPKEFWDKWLDQHRSMDMVKNKLIDADVSEASLRSRVLEYEKQRSGLEPLDQTSLPNVGTLRVDKFQGTRQE